MYVPSDLAFDLGGLARAYLESDQSSEMASVCLHTPFNNTEQKDWIDAVNLWNSHGRQLIENIPARGCPSCGQMKYREIFTSHDGYPYCECLNCGCWYVPLKVEAKVFENFFAICPAAKKLVDTVFRRRQTIEFEMSNLERIGGYLDHLLPLLKKPNGNIRYLDIGCGLGYSLKAANLRGMVAVGTESSAECLAIAKKNDLDVRSASESLSGETFDLISLWESLEHIADPFAVLEGCFKMLDEDGLLAFTVPNQNSPPVRVQRADCYVVHGGYDTPGHINLFNPHTLELLMARAGFSLLYVDGQYGMNAREMVAYLAGRHGGAHDLLAETVADQKQTGLAQLDDVILQGIGPVVSILERVLLASPILYCIACKAGNEARFAEAVAAAKARRKEELSAQISALGSSASQRLDAANARIAVLEQELARAQAGTLRRLARNIRSAFQNLKD